MMFPIYQHVRMTLQEIWDTKMMVGVPISRMEEISGQPTCLWAI